MKILIELPTWIGDCVMLTPSIENLRENYKNISITFLGPKTSLALFKNFPGENSYHEINKSFFSLIKYFLLQRDFDMFISCRSSLRTSFLKFFLRAPVKRQFNKNVYSIGHQVEKYNAFFNSFLEIKKEPGKLKLYRSNSEIQSKKKKLGINPGAAYGSAKRWTKEGFIEVS